MAASAANAVAAPSGFFINCGELPEENYLSSAEPQGGRHVFWAANRLMAQQGIVGDECQRGPNL